jgi:hypothetical protein
MTLANSIWEYNTILAFEFRRLVFKLDSRPVGRERCFLVSVDNPLFSLFKAPLTRSCKNLWHTFCFFLEYVFVGL